ncbi:MAG: hypothetical protein H6813_00275 [Phycisphaeraceae bacterium]|nr:hypothetical protein [Phycisphaeraceae bacterium]MCB9847480.1 hypothetical protein [Phycisphaeraceae bacterium]
MQAHEAFSLLRGNGQPWLFVVQAVEIASSPDMVRDLLRYTVYGEIPPRPLPPRPSIEHWVAMYRSHRSMQNGIAAGLGLPAELLASEGLDELRAISRMSRDEVAADVAEFTREEQEEFLRLFIGVPFPPDDATLRTMIAELDAEDRSEDPDEDLQFDELMASPAGQFFFRVWWPCWVLYHDYPPRLLRAARHGDMKALDRLLRLDKFAAGDPGVARVIGEIMSSGSANNKKQLSNALAGQPTVKLTDASIRAGLGALISQLAFLAHTTVTAPQIQALFDAIERVRTGKPTDTKITATGESWSKAIQRGRNWPGMPTRPAGQ